MTDSLVVYLHDKVVGKIARRAGGRIGFDFDEEYLRDPNRPTLSMSFASENGEIVGGPRDASSGLIPPFFSNLLPEGYLRKYLAEKAGVSEHREFEMLELLGQDLPGAVMVVRTEGSELSFGSTTAYEEEAPDGPLRFSLAGVQLKFSAIVDKRNSLTIPTHGMGGNWIVKLPTPRYDGLSENEYSVMSMADRLGVDVPEIRLMPVQDIAGLPDEVNEMPDANAFVIRRFDRSSGRRIHTEDFAQLTERRPDDKYDTHVNYTALTRLIALTCSEDDVMDFSRRLMFNTIVGNGDMHLKNWSFIYPDDRTPKLAPAYDFMCTDIYAKNESLALKLGSARQWHEITLEEFGHVADGAGVNRAAFMGAAADMVTRFYALWEDNVHSLPMDDQLQNVIERQMKRCPAIKSVLGQTRISHVQTKNKNWCRD